MLENFSPKHPNPYRH